MLLAASTHTLDRWIALYRSIDHFSGLDSMIKIGQLKGQHYPGMPLDLGA